MKRDKLINTAYAIGAAIVIYGAWAKLLHKEGADTFLTVGLLTEVVIFLISAMVEWLPGVPVKPSSESITKQVATDSPSEHIKELTNTLKKIYNLH